MVTPQEWLDKKYKDKKIEVIDLTDLNADQEGELEIKDFPNLIKIKENKDIHKITKLTITKCPKLKDLNFSYNQLTELRVDNPETLTMLRIANNKFTSDLKFLEKFTNLTVLDLGGNSLTGSLQPLQNMTKLKTLDIGDTDIESGLEYLPSSLNKELYCESWGRDGAKVENISKELENHGSDGNYKLRNWRGNTESVLSAMKRIANDFSKKHLRGVPIWLFTREQSWLGPNTLATTSRGGWNSKNNRRPRHRCFFITFSSDLFPSNINLINAENNAENKDRGVIFYTLAHELAHTYVMLRESSSTFPYFDQKHSKLFWEEFFLGQSTPSWPTLNFVKSELGGQYKKDLTNFAYSDKESGIWADNRMARWFYFPDAKVGKELVGKVRWKKNLVANLDYPSARKLLIGDANKALLAVDYSMNNPSGWIANWKWSSYPEKLNRWVQIELRKKSEENQKNAPKKYVYKIYVFYNQDIPIELERDLSRVLQLYSLSSPHGSSSGRPQLSHKTPITSHMSQWEGEIISDLKVRDLEDKKKILNSYPSIRECGSLTQEQLQELETETEMLPEVLDEEQLWEELENQIQVNTN